MHVRTVLTKPRAFVASCLSATRLATRHPQNMPQWPARVWATVSHRHHRVGHSKCLLGGSVAEKPLLAPALKRVAAPASQDASSPNLRSAGGTGFRVDRKSLAPTL
jgi:hypothetical protein